MAFDFGLLQRYVDNDKITDINFNGKDLWLDHLEKGRYSIENFWNASEIEKLCNRLSNEVNKQFNLQTPVLESDLDNLRISAIHPCITNQVSLSIRKTSLQLRLSESEMVEGGYLSKNGIKFLKYCVLSQCNIMVSGLPGSGKTELIKYLSSYISEQERVITIEDSFELHYRKIFKNRDCISMKVDTKFNYQDAIKTSLRQRPDWILLSEVRGEESLDLLNCIATGTHLLSTIHAQNAHEIPNRLLNMIPSADIANEILYDKILNSLDVGVHIDLFVTAEGITRSVREIVVYDDKQVKQIYQRGNKRLLMPIPESIKEKAQLRGVKW